MERVLVAIASVVVFLGVAALPAQAQYCSPPQPMCAPPCPPPCTRHIVTRMVPCVRTECVAEVQPSCRVVPVKRIGWKPQQVMLKGTPVGSPCGQDPCTTCCPQPFCQVVTQKVPFEYYEYRTVPWYNIVYKSVRRPVMLPQQYVVEAAPVCN
jgi:hypothetical protein